MKIKILIVFFLFLVINGEAKDVVGVISDDNHDGLPYSVLIVKGKKIATISDSIGRFSLPSEGLEMTDTLIFSYLGYETKKWPLTNIWN